MDNFNEGIINNESKSVQAAASSGNDIAALQNELNRQGFRDENGNELAVDGIPEALTLSACPVLEREAKGENNTLDSKNYIFRSRLSFRSGW